MLSSDVRFGHWTAVGLRREADTLRTPAAECLRIREISEMEGKLKVAVHRSKVSHYQSTRTAGLVAGGVCPGVPVVDAPKRWHRTTPKSAGVSTPDGIGVERASRS